MIYVIIATVVIILLSILCFSYYRKNYILSKKNEELVESYASAEEKLQNALDFISSLSQELRTPLYGIMGLTNILAEENTNLKNDQNLKSLKFSGDYLLTLINTVLQVNYLDNDQIIVSKKKVNLKELTQNLVHSFSYATENSDNTLHFEYDSQIPELVIGDPSIVCQILMNLISNSLRFTNNGNVYFTVNFIKSKGSAVTISFKIKHDGSELSTEDEMSIYKEFIDIGKAQKSFIGTGLKATIIKKLAASLNGEIILREESGAGSEYAFVVDFEKVDLENSVKDKDKDGVKQINKQKVLIVDDNKLNLLVADKMLSQEKFECTTVDNGYDAIELVRENAYDIILMDINMPKLNGIGTTKLIRKFNTETPIIALTAVDVTQLNRQIIQAGLNDYMLKPYNKKLLLEKIYGYLPQPEKKSL